VPELPEVETVANGVNARVAGERIVCAWFSNKPEPMKTAPALMERVLTGSRIARVHRVGKTVVFDLEKLNAAMGFSTPPGRNDNPSFQWLVHLGMTGRLLVTHADVPQPPHTHAVLSLGNDSELRFVDPRRFGRMSIHGLEGPDLGRGGKKQAPGSRQQATASGPLQTFAGTGAEPLTINSNDFAALFAGRNTPIKSALLNQKLLHGVGNIYADEALFRAGVRPARRAARVTRAEMEMLRLGLRNVLRQAIKLGGSSVNDYVDADGSRGFFQLKHRVYQRTGEPCHVCKTPIARRVIGGRSSHYCPNCQR
jgi:formamidopyrimidine-DNA glycosylase